MDILSNAFSNSIEMTTYLIRRIQTQECILSSYEAQKQTLLIDGIETIILFVATGGGIDWKSAPKKFWFNKNIVFW